MQAGSLLLQRSWTVQAKTTSTTPHVNASPNSHIHA